MLLHLNRNLIDRSSQSFRLYHQLRRSVFHSTINNDLWIHMSLLFYFLQHIEIHLPSNVLLAVKHDIVNELLRQGARTWIQTKFFIGKLLLSHEQQNANKLNLFRLLSSMKRSSFSPFGSSISIIFSSNNLIFYSRQVLCPPPLHQHHTVFLDSMLLSRDVCPFLRSIRKPNSSNLSLRGVRFFRSLNRNFQTHSSLKRSSNLYFLIMFQSIKTKL